MPRPNQSTQNQPLAPVDFLHQCDTVTQEVIDIVMSQQQLGCNCIKVPGASLTSLSCSKVRSIRDYWNFKGSCYCIVTITVSEFFYYIVTRDRNNPTIQEQSYSYYWVTTSISHSYADWKDSLLLTLKHIHQAMSSFWKTVLSLTYREQRKNSCWFLFRFTMCFG